MIAHYQVSVAYRSSARQIEESDADGDEEEKVIACGFLQFIDQVNLLTVARQLSIAV